MSEEKIIIDGHAHACGEYLTTEKIDYKLRNANVDMVLLSPGEYGSKVTYKLKNLVKDNPLGDVISKINRITSIIIWLVGAIRNIPKGNEFVYQLKRDLPSRVKQCYWVTLANYKYVQKDYVRMQFDTIKFHQCWEKFDLEDTFFVKTVEWATEMKLPVFIHIRNLVQVKKMIQFIKQHPKAIIVIGHLYGLELFMREEKRYFENTYFDLSNCYFVSKERTMMAYDHFGASHLMMGSDTPYGKQSLENTIQQIWMLKIPSSDRERILGLNLAELFSYTSGYISTV